MNNDKTEMDRPRSVVAIVKDDDRLKGVELRKQNGALEIVWTKSAEEAGTDWIRFSAECRLTPEQSESVGVDHRKRVIIGYNSAGTIFHHTTVPEVGEKEIASIVELQAESRLPLPTEQIEMAWRTDTMMGGEIGITMAVARKEQLQSFAQSVQSIRPEKILLDCEGIVKAWWTLFTGTETKAVILSMGTWNTLVCLVENGRLSNAVVLDMGIEDFPPEGAQEQNETTERFVQDLRSVLILFGCTGEESLPVCILSDGNALHESIVSSLQTAQFNARRALPDIHRVKVANDPGAELIYQYRASIGLALLALEGGKNELNIFSRVYSPKEKKEKMHWLSSPKLAGALAAVMLLLLALVAYAVDVKKPGAITKQLEASFSDVDMDRLVERQQLIRAVAQERPDMLDLLKLVNESGENGITLNSLQFKKGQLVAIGGQAGNNDQLRDFEKSLQDKKGIEDVTCTPTT
ncbi:MAG: hypothetical protein JXM79_12600, partial [Sedimentisphaerales bacterium]|nr:hypothetical protein [Sedimentisphaerales bacterium]